MGMLLRYPYEVRDASEYFDDIQDVKGDQGHAGSGQALVEQKSGHFELEKFETTMSPRLPSCSPRSRRAADARQRKTAPGNVVNLMDALRPASSHRRRPRLGPQMRRLKRR